MFEIRAYDFATDRYVIVASTTDAALAAEIAASWKGLATIRKI